MIKLYSKGQAIDALIKINLENGKAQEPYDEKCKFVPRQGGYTIYVDRKEFKWAQVLARTLAKLEVYKLSIDSKIEKDELYALALGLYDGKHQIVIECNLDKDTLSEVEKKVNCVNEFRQIADSDSKQSTPISLVNKLFEKIQKAATSVGAVASLKLIKRGDSEFSNYVGLNTVGLASAQDPCMGIIDYCPQGISIDSPIEVALVGKGITFDTGGYSLKPEKFMETMRTDKTAVVYLAGALTLAIMQGLKRHVRLYLCCSENMVSSQGMLPGDIIEYPNKVTVEINNTDAEGRLVLADGLLQACKDKAQVIIDMATLTGAAKIAVGRDMSCILSKHQSLVQDITKCFDKASEMYWQMPLFDYHKRFLSSRRADMTNSGHGEGAPGASVAAAFLTSFVDKDIPYAHIDLSSAYLPDGSPFLAAGPTGSLILGLSYYLVE